MNKPPPKSEILDRKPPSDLEAERAVLGSVLILPSMLDEIAGMLAAADFYDDANAEIFRHMLALHEAGKRIDVSLLRDRLLKTKSGRIVEGKEQSMYDALGGAAYLAEISRSVATAANAVHYAAIVRDASTQRAMIEAATMILRDSYEPRMDVDEHLAEAERSLFSVRDKRMAGCERIIGAADLLQSALNELESRERGDTTDGMTTGFSDLNRMMKLRPGHLVIVAGRPSMGKSAFAVNVGMHVAAELVKHVLFVTLEMSELELADRMIASMARIDSEKLKDPMRLTKDERGKLLETVSQLSAHPFSIDYSPTRNLLEIAAACRRQKRKHGLALLIVDYLQLVSPSDTKVVREQQVAALSKGFKAMARELEVPVMLLAQLNRQSEQTEGKKPRLSNLRESGSIEQDADAVILIHRPEYYMTVEQARAAKVEGIAEINIAKQRGGPTGEVRLMWNARWTRFDNLAIEQQLNYEPALREYSQPDF